MSEACSTAVASLLGWDTNKADIECNPLSQYHCTL